MNTNPSAMPEKTRTEDLPLISVIVPVYKAERYLDRCIQSIVDQTYRNLEIILVMMALRTLALICVMLGRQEIAGSVSFIRRTEGKQTLETMALNPAGAYLSDSSTLTIGWNRPCMKFCNGRLKNMTQTSL